MTQAPATLRPLIRLSLLATLALSGCSSPSEPGHDADRGVFEVEVSGETFVVEVVGADRVSQLVGRLNSGARGVINGRLGAGDAGLNTGWSWHMDPETVEAPDLSIELCDGRPSMVEADLDYWLGTVGQFCPWGAKVVRRIS